MPEPSDIRDVDIAEQMQQAYIDYAMSVITARALPDARDGLLPVHRRILYAMHESGNTHEKAFRKSAKTVGEVIGQYHPHGDMAVYGSLVRLAQDFSLRYPLVEGHGNFGSIDDDPPAAMRYTEARLSRIAAEMMRDIDKETVDFVPNYDDTGQEPVVLPSRFPNLLCNGSIGIAVGMSTNVPPHNLREVIAATVRLIEHPEATSAELAMIVRGPDFPTGGLILGKEGIHKAFETGRGSITVRGRAEIVEGRGDRQQIVISEIPYGLKKSALIERIAELYREKRLDGISGVTDASDRHGMRLVVELHRGANANVVLNQLYKDTPLQQGYGIRLLALVDGRPRLLSLRDALHHYLEHQREVVRRRTEFELRRAERRAHILEGLLIALDHLDEVIALIRASATRAEASAGLQQRFGLTELQADAILDMRLVQLTGLERHRLEEEYRELLEAITRLRAILASEELLLGVIREELEEIAERFGDDRRTEIVAEQAEGFALEDLVPVQRVVVTLTGAGYCKRLPLDTYRSQARGGRGVAALTTREDDFVTQLIVASSHDHVFLFTDAGRVYRLRVFEIPEAGRTARGTALVNLLPLDPGERIDAVIPVPAEALARAAEADGRANAAGEDDEEGEDAAAPEEEEEELEGAYMILSTRAGRVKRLRLQQLTNVRKTGLIAIGLEDGDHLNEVRLCRAGDEALLVSRRGQAARFPVAEVRTMGRAARGVVGMRLGPDDEVIGMGIVAEGCDLLIVSEKGIGKRTPLDEFPSHHRGTSGVRAQRLGPKSGPLVGVRVVRADDQVALITAQGNLIRQEVRGIPSQGRSAMGVTLKRLGDGDAVVSMAPIARDEDSEDSEE